MKNIILIITFITSALSYAQEGNRGSIASKKPVSKGGKKALIIGISDYQEKALQLNYADNDAVLFKNYLKEIEKISNDDIHLLINQEATSLHILQAIKNLLKNTKSGDLVYIYFAGHGDVVDDFGAKEGFLLAADANASQEYYSGGVIPLSLLNNKIINAFVQKGAKVALILDACRSGFIFEEGTQKNLGAIQSMFENTTKFLSCGPNELSYESADLQHGYFTYYLVKGLIGNADTNHDKDLLYREIDDYLYDKVASTVTQKHNQKQIPIVSTQNDRAAIRKEILIDASFDFSTIAKQTKTLSKAISARAITSTKELSLETKEILKKFNFAMDRGDYYGKNSSAFELYNRAKKKNTITESLLEKMKQLLIEKLSSSAQNLINDYINGEKLPNGSEFIKQAKNLEVCLSLLDVDDFLRTNFKANKLVLEAYASIRNKNHFGYRKAKKQLKEALIIIPNGAYIHNALGLVYNAEEKYDSAHVYFNNAKKLIRSWKNPTLNLGDNYLDQYKYQEAREHTEIALGMNGSQLNSFLNLARISEREGKYHIAEKYYDKVLGMEPNNLSALQRMSTLQEKKGNRSSAIKWFQKAMESDSLSTLINYGILKYIKENNIDKKTAENIFIDLIDKKPNSSTIYTQYADFLRTTKFRYNRNMLIDSLYTKAIILNPTNEKAYVGKANYYFKLRKKELALKTFDNGLLNNKRSPFLLYSKGNFFIKAFKDYTKAMISYHKALEIDDKFLPAHAKIIEINNKNGKYVESIATLEALTSKSPEVQDLWNLMGDTHYAAGAYSKAAISYKKAIKLDHTYAKSYNKLGKSQLENAEFDAAKSNLQLAISYNPKKNKKANLATFIISMAKEQNRFGTIDKAQELYKIAFEINPSVKTSISLATFLYLNNKSKEAITIARLYADKTTTKSEKIYLLEILVKSAIEIGNVNLCNSYYKPLLNTLRTPDYLLAAVYSNFLGDKKGAEVYLKKVNPELLKINKLKGKFSKQTIKDYIIGK